MIGEASIHAKFGELDAAEREAREARELAMICSDRPLECEALVQLAQNAVVRGQHDEAGRLADDAAALIADAHDDRVHGLVLNAQALVAKTGGRLDDAVRLGEQWVELQRRIDDPRSLGTALNNLANDYLDAGKADRANDLYNEAVDAFRASGDRLLSAIFAADLARQDVERGDLQAARLHYQWAISDSRVAELHDDVPQYLDELRPVLAALRGETEWTVEAALERASRSGSLTATDVATLGAEEASLAGVSADFRAIALALAMSHSPGSAVLFLLVAVKNRTQRLLNAGDLLSVLAWSRFGSELSSIAGHDVGTGIFLNDEGFTLLELGDFDAASQVLSEAIKFAEALRDPYELTARLKVKAICLERAERRDEALQAAQYGAASARTILDDEHRLALLVDIGDIFDRLRAWPESLATFSDAVAEATRLEDWAQAARSFQAKGKAQLEMGQFSAAAADRAEASRLFGLSGEKDLETQLAFLAGVTLQRAHATEDAIRWLDWAFKLARENGMNSIAAEASTRLAALRRGDS